LEDLGTSLIATFVGKSYLGLFLRDSWEDSLGCAGMLVGSLNYFGGQGEKAAKIKTNESFQYADSVATEIEVGNDVETTEMAASTTLSVLGNKFILSPPQRV